MKTQCGHVTIIRASFLSKMVLKSLRVTAAILFFAALTSFFADYLGFLPLELHGPAHLQVAPALLASAEFGIGLVVAVWIILTLLFGRLYCSVVCPLGVLQDVMARFRRKRRYKYRRPQHLLRYGLLTVCIAAFLIDLHLILILLDPYGIYGRLATHLLRPPLIFAHNQLALIVNARGYYGISLVPNIVSWPSVLLSLAMLLVVAHFAWHYGRRYCNTICPVGTLLGLFSRKSLFRICLRDDCISCGLCERACKAECIDSKAKTVDGSRCVACFNCLSVCKRDSLLYGINTGKPVLIDKETPAEEPVGVPAKSEVGVPALVASPCEASECRRTFLGILFAVIGASLGAAVPSSLSGVSKSSFAKKHPITPPGSGNIRRFQKRCTACHLCVTKCPTHIIRPAIADYGPSGFLQPVVSFEHGFCNFDCVICSRVCPNLALISLDKEEKHRLQIGKVNFIKENCIVDSQQTNCGACAEHCPTGAVTMVPVGKPEDALTIPQIDPDLCVGCGACEYICPVRPFRAIYVDGNPTHLEAKPAFDPTLKQQEVKLDDFGF